MGKRGYFQFQNKITESPFHPQGNPSLLQLVLQVSMMFFSSRSSLILFGLPDGMNDREWSCRRIFADFRKGRFGHGATRYMATWRGRA
jgi:hypothetical protein